MGKKIIVALAVTIALALPMRTGFDAGQIVSVMAPPTPYVVKVEKPKKLKALLTEKEKEIAAFVKGINPAADASLLARHIVKYAPKAHLTPELFASLLAHESGFKREVVVCFKWKGISMCDHGLAQVNDYFWAGKFDFEKLQKDDGYAIQAGAKILAALHKLYGDSDEHWWSTYNSTVVRNRVKYEALVNAKFSAFQNAETTVKI